MGPTELMGRACATAATTEKGQKKLVEDSRKSSTYASATDHPQPNSVKAFVNLGPKAAQRSVLDRKTTGASNIPDR